MPHGRDDPLCKILHGKTYCGSVDTRMEADILSYQNIPVDDEPYPVFPVIGKTQDTQRTRCDIQKGLHKFGVCKGQPGRTDKLGKHACFEGLIAGDQQKVKVRLLPVAEEQVLADLGAQSSVNIFAVLHGVSGGVLHTLIGDAQLIQQSIGFQFNLGVVGGGGRGIDFRYLPNRYSFSSSFSPTR